MNWSLKLYSLIAVGLFCSYPVLGDAPSPGSIDISSFIKGKEQKISLMKVKVNKIGEEKGYDPKVAMILHKVNQEIDSTEEKLKVLKSIEDYPKGIMKNLDKIEKQLNSLETMKVGEPKEFPERCLVLTLDSKGKEKAQNDGLVEKTGIVETYLRRNNWVLVVHNPSAPEAVDRFPLGDNVGLIGSSDPNSGNLVRSRTPNNMSVTGWVDMSTKKVMCLSKPESAK